MSRLYADRVCVPVATETNDLRRPRTDPFYGTCRLRAAIVEVVSETSPFGLHGAQRRNDSLTQERRFHDDKRWRTAQHGVS